MQKDLPALRVKNGELREKAKLFEASVGARSVPVGDDFSQYISWDPIL